MLRPMSVPSKSLLVLAVLIGVVGCGSPAQEQAAPLAEWVLAQQPKPDDMTLQLVVQEQSCSGGRAPDGRIVTEMESEANRILVTVRVEPLEEGGTCSPNPPTAHTVRLDEPVGERAVLDAALRPPAPPTPPFPGFAPAR